MSIRLYDEAIVWKIKSWLPTETKVSVLSPDDLSRLYEIEARENGDKPVTLPMITVSRNTDVTMELPTWTPSSRYGYTMATNEDKWFKFRNITIKLDYQIDIYTKKAIEADALLTELVYKLMLDNQIVVHIKNWENLDLKHVSTITLDSTLRDTSDISERLFPGQFTRWTINASINDAHLFSTPYKNLWSIEGEMSEEE